jgi:hypothetical protein
MSPGELGPVQVVVVGFADPSFSGAVLAELSRLETTDVIRLVDLLVVAVDAAGILTTLESGDLRLADGRPAGELAAAFFGGGGDIEGGDIDAGAPPDAQTWSLARAVPPGTAAAVALIEHRWAIALSEAVLRAGGRTLEDTWLDPAARAELGALLPATGT